MNAVLLVDFGSTRTKVTAVDVENCLLIGTASAATTIRTDINEGLSAAMEALLAHTGPLSFSARYACSSAAGGLRMAAIGLVPDLTVAAAKTACLGAGAKLIGSYGFELTQEDLAAIVAAAPDIILLTGGTDGGNTACILHNAAMLSGVKPLCPVVVAGNRSAAGKAAQALAGWEVMVTENVMPKLGRLNADPAAAAIRRVFLQRIVEAKGLTKAAGLMAGIVMPTPAAVLEAMLLLSRGTEKTPGLGELIAVDLGGATTDVYSMTDGLPQNPNTVLQGLSEPYAKRTVEGDIGMRYGAEGIIQEAGLRRIGEISGLEEQQIKAMTETLQSRPEALPVTPEETALDDALAKLAVQTAVRRHAGTVEQVFTPMGMAYAQHGKDLSAVTTVILTGGALIHAWDPAAIGAYACAVPAEPYSLRPKTANILLDRDYILSAMGLLAEHYPEAAMTLMKRHLGVLSA